jgi:hypothetical protein
MLFIISRVLLCAVFVLMTCAAGEAGHSPRLRRANDPKIRLVVISDISTLTARNGEPDDTQSLVRLLLYSNDFDIEGLIAAQTGKDLHVHPEYMRDIVRKYGKVRGNLALHAKGYPTEQHLLNTIHAGRPGVETVGVDWDSDASESIIGMIDKPDPRPVWFTIWGGPRELAQAIYKVARTRTPSELAKFKSKIRIYAIGDQDPTGEWIRTTHPDIFYIKTNLVFRGLYRGGDTSLVNTEWVENNIVRGHGALGAAYPNYAGGDPWGAVKGVKEGDTPSFLYLIPNGLGNPQQPAWGSWGGRFVRNGNYYFDAKDTVDGDTSERATTYRWRSAFQNDFQARMDWCVKPYKEANHPPIAVIAGDLRLRVRPGTVVKLSAAGSSDPDGNKLSYKWFFYPEPSSCNGSIVIENANKLNASFVAPAVKSAKTIHIILTVTDNGAPPLSRYGRIVVTVDPKA